MKNLKYYFFLIFIIPSLLLTACGGKSPTEPQSVTLDTLTTASTLPQPDGRKDYWMIVEPVTNKVANQGVQTNQATKYYLWFYGLNNLGNAIPLGIDMQDIVNGSYKITAIVFWPYTDEIHTITGINLYYGGIVGISQDFIKQHVENPESLSNDAQKTMISICIETAKAKQADPKFCIE